MEITLVITLVGLSVSGGLSLAYFMIADSKAEEVQDDVHIELLRMNAPDGVLLKALLLVTPENKIKTDQSVPLIICGHGMFSDFWFSKDLFYTLAKNGYVVLSLEFRGHKSNVAPCTFGNLEPYDILSWLNYAETNFPYVNASCTGIIGHSLGGMFATAAYIFESQGRGRIKALVDVSGAVNLTRAFEQFISDPTIFGNAELVKNITLKNPINYVYYGFPKNVLIIHGTHDHVVDIQCSVDFLNKLDPDRNRTDVVFYEIEDNRHDLFVLHDTILNATAWFDTYVKEIPTDPDSIIYYSLSYGPYYGSMCQFFLLVFCFLLIVLFGCTTYLVRPKLYDLTLPDFLMKGCEDPRKSRIPRDLPYQKMILFLSFVGINGITYLIVSYISSNFMNNIVIVALLSFLYVVLIYYFGGSPADKRNFYRWVNPKVALIWIVSFIIAMYVYQILPGLPIIENNILYPGVRLTWYVPYLTTGIMILILSNILFLRFLFVGKKRPKNMKFKEASLSGFLVFISYMVLMSNNMPTILTIPIIRIEIPMVPTLSLGFGLLYMGFSAMTQFLSKYSKTLVTGALLSGIIFSFFFGASQATFIY